MLISFCVGELVDNQSVPLLFVFAREIVFVSRIRETFMGMFIEMICENFAEPERKIIQELFLKIIFGTLRNSSYICSMEKIGKNKGTEFKTTDFIWCSGFAKDDTDRPRMVIDFERRAVRMVTEKTECTGLGSFLIHTDTGELFDVKYGASQIAEMCGIMCGARPVFSLPQ